jgi:hypothetical protein
MLWRPVGLWDVKDPALSRQSSHRWQLSALSAGHALPPETFSVNLSCYRLSKLQNLNKCNDFIETQPIIYQLVA